MPSEIAEAIYKILQDECGAPDDGWMRTDFVRYVSDKSRGLKEFRFQGSLGFGGKFYLNPHNGVKYVSCYSEDRTPERIAAIERANQRLQEIACE